PRSGSWHGGSGVRERAIGPKRFVRSWVPEGPRHTAHADGTPSLGSSHSGHAKVSRFLRHHLPVRAQHVKAFLGVDGVGSKTRFLRSEESGAVLASHAEGPAYYLEIGLEALTAMLSHGVAATLAQASVAVSDVAFAFFGIPAYGEDRSLLARLDAAPAGTIPA